MKTEILPPETYEEYRAKLLLKNGMNMADIGNYANNFRFIHLKRKAPWLFE